MIAGPTSAETEVDDVDKTLLCGTHTATPATGLLGTVRERFGNAPNRVAQGTAVPFAGSSARATALAAAPAAVVGVRSTDLPGCPPRGAPV